MCIEGQGEALRELLYVQGGARFAGAEAHADLDLLRLPSGRLQLNLHGRLRSRKAR